MNDKIQQIFRQLTSTLGPFIVLGIAVACIIGLFILSWYLLVWGLMIGFMLWVCALIKRYLFSEKLPIKTTKGRIIEHDKQK